MSTRVRHSVADAGEHALDISYKQARKKFLNPDLFCLQCAYEWSIAT